MEFVNGAQRPEAKVTEIIADASVRISEGNTAVAVMTNRSSLTVTLPNVSKSADTFILVVVRRTAPGGVISATVAAADYSGLTAIVLDAINEYTCLYSDGIRWYEVSSFHA